MRAARELWYDRPLKCPYCQAELDGADCDADGNAAEPGSLVICDLCLMPSVLTESLDLAVPGPEARARIEADPEGQEVARERIRRVTRPELN